MTKLGNDCYFVSTHLPISLWVVLRRRYRNYSKLTTDGFKEHRYELRTVICRYHRLHTKVYTQWSTNIFATADALFEHLVSSFSVSSAGLISWRWIGFPVLLVTADHLFPLPYAAIARKVESDEASLLVVGLVILGTWTTIFDCFVDLSRHLRQYRSVRFAAHRMVHATFSRVSW